MVLQDATSVERNLYPELFRFLRKQPTVQTFSKVPSLPGHVARCAERRRSRCKDRCHDAERADRQASADRLTQERTGQSLRKVKRRDTRHGCVDRMPKITFVCEATPSLLLWNDPWSIAQRYPPPPLVLPSFNSCVFSVLPAGFPSFDAAECHVPHIDGIVRLVAFESAFFSCQWRPALCNQTLIAWFCEPDLCRSFKIQNVSKSKNQLLQTFYGIDAKDPTSSDPCTQPRSPTLHCSMWMTAADE